MSSKQTSQGSCPPGTFNNQGTVSADVIPVEHPSRRPADAPLAAADQSDGGSSIPKTHRDLRAMLWRMRGGALRDRRG
jgi:hypothetical protein